MFKKNVWLMPAMVVLPFVIAITFLRSGLRPMAGTELTVDSTYRWIEVLLMAAAFAACLIRGAYNVGFSKKLPLRLMLGASALVACGVALAPVFGESIVDAVLLRARFGFIVPDGHPHGYAWFFMFGYALLLAGTVLLIIGFTVTAVGKVRSWISKNHQSKDEGAT
jgi:hypothetical protein